MRRITLFKTAAALGAATMLVFAAPLAAQAHVTVTPSSTAASSYSVLTFSVGHGCDGSPTTALTFTVPDAIESVTPTVNPGWDITTEGNQVSYRAAEPLEDGLRTTFALSVKLPDQDAGGELAFPVLQTCEVGETDWSEVATSDGEEPEHPAPVIVLSEPTGDAHGHTAAGDALPASSVSSSGSADVLARVLGITGLLVGTVGVTIGISTRRKEG